MSFDYLTIDQAIVAPGLRMVVVGNVPSPWGEAAKGFFHIKRLPFSAVRLAYDSEALAKWTGGQLSGPVVIHDNEIPRSGWAEILMLAERLAPTPALLPLEPQARGKALLLAEKFCGQGGLGWTRRLQQVHAALSGRGGFPEKIAGYLGKKYGYDPAEAGRYGSRVRQLLGEVAAPLREQREAGKPYYLGDTLSATDVYSATFMALFRPLPEEHCRMHPAIRPALEMLDDETAAAIDPVLIEHRDMMYARHLELPLSL
jgi:glutathione S-transferase